MKKIIYVVVLIAFFSCQNQRKMYSQLEKIDTLLHTECYDSAYQLIGQLDVATLTNEEDSAYYYMLLTWGRFVKYIGYTSHSNIDKSICFYKKKQDKSKLALAYAIKGGAVYEVGNIEESINCLKESEKLAKNLNDIFIEYKLYGELAFINNQEGKYQLALIYSKKRLRASILSRKINRIVTSLNQMAVAHYGLSQMDSACYYINKCIPYIGKLEKKEKGIVLDNIGFLNMEKYPQKALKYLRIAEKECPSVDTYDNLARIYARQGKEQLSDKYWRKALSQCDIKHSITILDAILKHKVDNNCSEEETGPIKSQLLVLKDSLAKHKEVNNVEKQQYSYDYQMEQEKKDQSMSWLLNWILILGIVLFASFVLIFFIWKNGKRLKACLTAKDSDIVKLQSIIDSKPKKCEKKSKRTTMPQSSKIKSEQIFQRGCKLYDSICSGKTVIMWSHEDFCDFFTYYTAIKNTQINTDLKKYSQLSDTLKLYLILTEEGWDKKRISECLGVSLATLRTYKYRLKEKEIANIDDKTD